MPFQTLFPDIDLVLLDVKNWAENSMMNSDEGGEVERIGGIPLPA